MQKRGPLDPRDESWYSCGILTSKVALITDVK